MRQINIKKGCSVSILFIVLLIISCSQSTEPGDRYAQRGIDLFKSGGDENKVISLLSKSLELGTTEYDIGEVYLYLGAAYNDLDNTKKAEEFYKLAIKSNPNLYSAWSNLGIIYKSNGDIQTAREHYVKSLEIKPDNAYALNNLGELLFFEGNTQDATGYYKKAIDIDPSIAVFHANLALAYADSGSFSEAEKSLRRAITLGYENYDEVRRRIDNLKKYDTSQ